VLAQSGARSSTGDGEKNVWDTLVGADLADNSAGWQWVAGCGADAAPFFRIFNPVSQGLRFDPDGAYVRAWALELASLPSAVIMYRGRRRPPSWRTLRPARDRLPASARSKVMFGSKRPFKPLGVAAPLSTELQRPVGWVCGTTVSEARRRRPRSPGHPAGSAATSRSRAKSATMLRAGPITNG
jgi:hypothetical protein